MLLKTDAERAGGLIKYMALVEKNNGTDKKKFDLALNTQLNFVLSLNICSSHFILALQPNNGCSLYLQAGKQQTVYMVSEGWTLGDLTN